MRRNITELFPGDNRKRLEGSNSLKNPVNMAIELPSSESFGPETSTL